MGHIMKKFFVSLTLFAVIISPSVYADKIYSWVDEKGVTHYGKTPPKDTPSRLINARTGHSEPVDYSGAEKKDDKKEGAKAAVATPDPERCANARKNLQVLTTNPRVRTTDSNGEKRFMTPEEMQAQVETMEQIIAAECAEK
jgi:Domain of unknown function (DUF4124)